MTPLLCAIVAALLSGHLGELPDREEGAAVVIRRRLRMLAVALLSLVVGLIPLAALLAIDRVYGTVPDGLENVGYMVGLAWLLAFVIHALQDLAPRQMGLFREAIVSVAPMSAGKS